MLTQAFISGRLGEVIPGYEGRMRYVEVDLTVVNSLGSGSLKTAHFPVYVPLGGSSFLTAKTGSLVEIKGRLGQDEKVGTFLIDECDEVYSVPASLKEEVEEHH